MSSNSDGTAASGADLAAFPAASAQGGLAIAPSDRAGGLVYDWNDGGRKGRITPKNCTFFDETLRDGLQNPSVVDPPVENKIAILHLMNDVGIHEADIGLPGSSKRAFEDCLRMCKE